MRWFMGWFLVYTILLIVSFATFVMYILGTAYYLTNHEENTCDMTYMFEYPQYVRVMLDENVENQFPRYGLYAYGEGVITERLRKMKFSGIPVLFIPGNAGSHEQVRSLASVSLRKSLNDRTQFHFDYFTVSFGKDYSALYGGLLMDETVYVSHCINKILSLYNGKYKTITIIGHSMGGIVAKGALLLNPNVVPTSANILINLATPHRPALIFDAVFANFYNNINNLSDYLNQYEVTMISIGGGHRDTLVSSAQIIDDHSDISTLSSSIPAVWKSTDHLCILWCKQLVTVIVRALFDSVDTSVKPAQILRNRTKNIEAFSYHLKYRYHGKKLDSYKEKVSFESDGVWMEIIETKMSWRGIDTFDQIPRDNTIFLMIPLSHPHDNVTIDTYELETKDWLFACSASIVTQRSRKCEWGWNLTNKTRHRADLKYKMRKVVDLSLSDIKSLKASHIVIKIGPESRKNVVVNIDVHSASSRITNIAEPNNLHSYLPWKKSVNMVNIEKGSVRHYINFTEMPDAVRFELKEMKCSNDVDKLSATVLVELVESWNPTTTQLLFFTRSDDGPKTFKVQQEVTHVNTSVHLQLTADPSCQYSFEVKRGNLVERLSVTVRDRWPVLYPVSIALLLMTISLKIDTDRFSTVGITVFVAFNAIDVYLECCVMVFILHVMAVGICCSIIFLGSVAHKVASRFLARAITFSVTWSEWLIGGLNQLPICTTVIIISIIPATCGALAMILTVFMYYLKLVHMYDDYLEELLFSAMRHFKIMKPKKEDNVNEDTRVKILNHLIIFMLLCFAALPAVPSVLVWAKNFGVSTKLSFEDPILLYSWIVIIICSMMDLIQIPTIITLRTQLLGYTLCVVSWIVLYLASIQNVIYNQWWMPPFVAR